jgi:colicin import membrane protein
VAISDRPHRPRRPRGKLAALVLAIAVNLVFLAVLIFSVSWQNRQPQAVSAELYAPPTKAPPVETPPPPLPQPKPAPPPEPKPPEPKPPEPKPPTPAPNVEKPPVQQPDIAEKARQEAERKRKEKEQAERERKEADAKKQEEKKQAELRERQQRDLANMRAQAEREMEQRRQTEREAQLRAQAERESRERATQAASAALTRAQADWIDRIRAKIKSNIILPPDIAGNPEARFDVVQLPTGEVIDVRLAKSSGVRAYDDAVQRAILKSSPLPRPSQPELFVRTLELRFRPQE